MESRAKYAYLSYDGMISKITDGTLDGYDIVYCNDTHENYVISPELEPLSVRSRVYVFDSVEEYCRYKIALLGNSNYKTFTRKPSEFADSLTIYAKYKYATDPNYKFKINNMYKQMWG